MSNTTLITREEIADMLGISVRMVKRNEKRWGLRMVRVDLNSRVVRYKKDQAMKVLSVYGVAQRVRTGTNWS